jgi:cytochrome c oxidase cbb3-type subunit II
MNIFNNHTQLFIIVTLSFIALSLLVAILPATYNQNNNSPLPQATTLSGDVLEGKKLFIENGCVACHTQQVRNVEMDKVWGTRPNVAADYAIHSRMGWWMNTATLMGTQRTGPDLTNIGTRLPSADWHLLHLYNPRAVVSESIMPAYPWLFTHKIYPSNEEKVVNIPEGFIDQPGTKVVAKKEALQLVAYLQSLQQASLTEEQEPEFLYQKETGENINKISTESHELDGAMLYGNNCQACHQASGEGLPGAFPSLKDSKIVLDDDPEFLVEIIMKGYNAREAFAEMPAVGQINNLKAEEVTAIVNHERTSWGNKARKVTVEEVTRIIAFMDKPLNQ